MTDHRLFVYLGWRNIPCKCLVDTEKLIQIKLRVCHVDESINGDFVSRIAYSNLQIIIFNQSFCHLSKEKVCFGISNSEMLYSVVIFAILFTVGVQSETSIDKVIWVHKLIQSLKKVDFTDLSFIWYVIDDTIIANDQLKEFIFERFYAIYVVWLINCSRRRKWHFK